jgi:phage terminase Nu1 subunit (DNA packaging protein)
MELTKKSEKKQWELNKENTVARTNLLKTKDKTAKLLLAKAREDLIDKDLVVKQAQYLFVAVRQKMLGAPLTYHRRFLHIEDPHVALERLKDVMNTMLRELKDFPSKITDSHWMDTVDEED